MTRERAVDVAHEAHADLGEGPWWDVQTGQLLWVDIFGEKVHRFDPTTGLDTHLDLGQPVSMVARRREAGLVCAVRDGIAFVDFDRRSTTLAKPIEHGLPTNRMNDGACDPAGRLWVGTMATDLSPSAGTLYRVDHDLDVTAVRRQVTVSNGLDWSPDGCRFYYTDSATRRIDVYDFDVSDGHIGNRRALVQLDDRVATPDGLTVDADGTIWVAMWDGGCLRRYRPTGELIETVMLPVTRPTSATFGGSNLDLLFITTARHGLNADNLRTQPHAGAILVIETKTCGTAPYAFAG